MAYNDLRDSMNSAGNGRLGGTLVEDIFDVYFLTVDFRKCHLMHSVLRLFHQ